MPRGLEVPGFPIARNQTTNARCRANVALEEMAALAGSLVAALGEQRGVVAVET